MTSAAVVPGRSKNHDPLLLPYQPRMHLLSMVLELPPAPAALVLLGRRFAVFSARSAAAFLRITVAGPPGGFGDAGRAVVEPEEAVFTGEVARGADYRPC
jgi:hypothetical protein